MSTFSKLDHEIDRKPSSSKQVNGTSTLVERLREFAPSVEYSSEPEDAQSPDESAMVVDEVVGDKRKLYFVSL